MLMSIMQIVLRTFAFVVMTITGSVLIDVFKVIGFSDNLAIVTACTLAVLSIKMWFDIIDEMDS